MRDRRVRQHEIALRAVREADDARDELPLQRAAWTQVVLVCLSERVELRAGEGLANTVDAFDDNQLNRLRVSMNRPAFERAPRTTTATCWPP